MDLRNTSEDPHDLKWGDREYTPAGLQLSPLHVYSSSFFCLAECIMYLQTTTISTSTNGWASTTWYGGTAATNGRTTVSNNNAHCMYTIYVHLLPLTTYPRLIMRLCADLVWEYRLPILLHLLLTQASRDFVIEFTSRVLVVFHCQLTFVLS